MKLIKIETTGLEFDNGTEIEDYHPQDCCESVYADWKQLEDTDVLKHEFKDDLKIEGVEGKGFRLEGYFIPCYNQQNGCYGSDLELQIITNNGKEKKTIDISSFVEDQID